MQTLEEWRQDGSTFGYGGHRVFYRRSGDGPALLLIHGFPTNSWDWRHVWGGLSYDYSVVAADMLGFGWSAKPKNYAYSIDDQATLHEALLDRLAIRDVHLLAHDYGTSVAQELLARHAERVQTDYAIRSVTLLNGGILPGTHRPLLIQRLLTSPLGGLLARCLTRASLRRSFDRIFGPRTQLTTQEIDEYWQLFVREGGRAILPRLMTYMAEREQRRSRWTEILRATKVPLRLINGSFDPISGLHVANAFRAHVPNADVIDLAEIGHYPQLESPQQVLAATLEHMRRAEASATEIG